MSPTAAPNSPGEHHEHCGEIGNAADLARHLHRERRGNRARQEAEPQRAINAEHIGQCPAGDEGGQAACDHAGRQQRPTAADQRALLIDRHREGDRGRSKQRHQPMRAADVVAIGNVEQQRCDHQQRRRHAEGHQPPARPTPIHALGAEIEQDGRDRPGDRLDQRLMP
jgi:hypothetical protein